MASSQSFSISQRRMLLSPWPASPVNSDEPLCTSAMRLPSAELWFIFKAILTRKSIWPSLERVTVPVRKWKLSLPIPLRLLLATQPERVTPVRQVVHRQGAVRALGPVG